MPSQPSRGHDLAYRNLFSHPELVEDLLRHFVNEAWVAEIDFATLQRESEVSVVRRRGARLRDVAWSVRFRERTLYILILIEFQSRVDPRMALRQMVYVASFYEDLCRQKRLSANGLLPPVLPVVLYNGERRWRVACSVEDMVEPVPESLARYQPRLSYFLLDEKHTRFRIDVEVRNLVGALLALEQSEAGDDLIETVVYLLKFCREPGYESLRQAFKDLITLVLAPEMAPIAEVFDHPEDPMTTRERLQDWYDKQKAASRAEGRREGRQEGRAEGRQEGRQEGRAEGRQEGRAEGQRNLLAKLLRLKFGRLDAATESRLATASLAELELFAERILTAASLAEVWE